MKGARELEAVTDELHSLFVNLASVCLKERPEDVERHCLEWLAKRQDMKLEPRMALIRGHSVALDDDISEFVNDIETAQHAISPFANAAKHKDPNGYASSEEGDVRRVASYHTVSENGGSDGEAPSALDTNSAAEEGGAARVDRKEFNLFSTTGISPEQLGKMTAKYVMDKRMRLLFKAWDGDGSGAVDFVELVVALHKFEQVAAAGIDIHVASEALVQFVKSDTERELKMREFAKVIIIFAHNNFGCEFDAVADHMLAVATSTSEAAVLRAAEGADVSELEAADLEEEEFLRLTAMGMEDTVSRNITRMRTKRVQFPKPGRPFKK